MVGGMDRIPFTLLLSCLLSEFISKNKDMLEPSHP